MLIIIFQHKKTWARIFVNSIIHEGTRPYRHNASSSLFMEPTCSLGWTCARCTKGHRLIKITYLEFWILATLKEICCPEVDTHLHFYSKKTGQGAPLSLRLTGTAWLAFRQLCLLPPCQNRITASSLLFLDAPWSLLTPELWQSIVWKHMSSDGPQLCHGLC